MTTVDELVESAREQLNRLTPRAAADAQYRGAALIDIRSDSQRAHDGGIPGARVIQRNVLEWRLDPASAHRISELAQPGVALIVICDEGFQSSLAAATLRLFGLDATDVIGGAQAWKTAGLPLET